MHPEEPVFDLKGKVAVVTGGNGGIGLGMAQGLAAAGAQIVVAARNREKSRVAVAEIERRGGTAIAPDVDVTSEASADARTKAPTERLGRLDIPVNNPGTNIPKPAHDLTFHEARPMVGTNLDSAV